VPEKYLARAIKSEEICEVARIEATIIIKEVADGNLPSCDLCLPNVNNGHLPPEVTLHNFVWSKRTEKLKSEFADLLRKTFVVQNEFGEIKGKGSIRFKPEEGRVVLYSFNIDNSLRGTSAGLTLLCACFDEIKAYDKQCPDKIKIVRAGRYSKSEERQPFFTSLARMVNRSIPDAVSIERYDWENQEVTAFNFPKEIAFELLEELGPKYSVMSL
jgi:hypothetical protein